jgi:multidrug efflux pump subunit AcrB
VTFYFQAADMVTQILNFGLAAQIDVRTVGRDRITNLRVAHELRRRVAAVPGIADAHLQQELDASAFIASIDRSRALELGLNAQAIANDLNISLSSSEQVSPNFWTDPTNGIPYYIAVQTPEHQESSLGELRNTPVSTTIASAGPPKPGLLSNAAILTSEAVPNIPGLLSNVATLQRDVVPTNLNQTNIQPVYDVYAAVQGRDLGSVSDDISKIVAGLQKELKPGNTIQVLGQIQSMNDSFRDLAIGLLFAAVFVYMLMVVNYQNFGDPFVVILALPATLCGIVTMLFITGDAQCPLLDGGHHGGWRGLGELHPVGHLRTGEAARRRDSLPGRDRRGPHPHPPCPDDGRRDDRRHDPHGDRRRRRGAGCGAGQGGDRRPSVRDPDHPADRPLSRCHAAQTQ